MDLNRKTSIVWNFFTPINTTEASCNLCKQTFKYKASISNLKSHFNRKHPKVKLTSAMSKLRRREQKIEIKSNALRSVPSTSNEVPIAVATSTSATNESDHSSTAFSSKIEFSDKKRIDESLLKLVTKDFQPLSIVEDEGFCEYSREMNPSYMLPSRRTLSNILLPAKYEEVYDATVGILNDATSVTLTTDCWTSCNNESFIAITVHFIDSNFDIRCILLETISFTERPTSINIANRLQTVVSKFNLEDKILLAVSENGANIKKAIKEELQWEHFDCYAHTINLIVQDALISVKTLIENTKEFVSHFKKSGVAKAKLDQYQVENGREVIKLKQSVPTRWNSVFYMFKALVELEEDVKATLAKIGKTDWPMLSNDEFLLIRELTKILAPMESVTKMMCGEKYVTASSVIVISEGLENVYSSMINNVEFSSTALTVINDINVGINTRLSNLESTNILMVSTFLDPRFKTVGFSNENAAEWAKTLTTNFLTNLVEKDSATDRRPDLINIKCEIIENDTTSSLWGSFDKKAATFEPTQRNNRSRAIAEIQRYLGEPLLNKTECPVEWWKANLCNYPYLSKVVRLKLATVATSVPWERFFSKSGQLLSDRRNKLCGNKVDQIMFIHGNNKCST